MAIRVTAMGAETKEVPYKDGMTVDDVLKIAGVTVSAEVTITVDGKEMPLDTKVGENAQIVVTPKIKQG